MTNLLGSIRLAGYAFSLIAALVAVPLFCRQVRARCFNWVRTAFGGLFLFYVLCVLALVFFPLPDAAQAAKLSTYRIQLVPFQFVADFLRETPLVFSDARTYLPALLDRTVLQVVCNILMLLPFGMYLRYVCGLDVGRVALASLAFSAFIELGQLTGLFFVFRGSYRLCDVDDLMLNTLGGLLGGGGLAGADGPHGLIGDDALAQLLGGYAGQRGLHLQGDELHGDAQLPLLQRLTHADNGVQTGLQRGQYLLVDDEIRLAEILAALGVADDDVLHAQILQHIGGDLAGVGAGLLKEHVLCANGHAGILESLDGGGDVHGGDAHHYVAPLGLGQQGLQLLGEFFRLAGGLVHLPVAGDNGLTVSAIHNLFTPLSSLNYSIDTNFALIRSM